MLRRYLIIDGYNLMHAAGLARRTYGPGQLERCRSQLLRHLARHLTGRDRERTTIVFDAADAPPDLPRRTTADGMTVCFASPGKDADDMIEELIAAHSAPRQIRLVSSDHRLQRSVRRRRGTFVDSEEFASELERRGPVAEAAQLPPESPPDASRKKPDDSGMDTETWLRIFGDMPEAADFAADQGLSHGSIDDVDVAAIQEELDRQDADGDPRAPKRPPRKNTKRRRPN
jgi:predicted RNA-binding protein with PIN domain